MEQVDAIFKAMAAASHRETLMACLYTGVVSPAAATPMRRTPAPPLGALLDQDFAAHVDKTMTIHQSLHDGAIMLGRQRPVARYVVTGWSYRLYPPPRESEEGENRGSAFHSCLSMSAQTDIDATYLISHGRAYRFCGGAVTEL